MKARPGDPVLKTVGRSDEQNQPGRLWWSGSGVRFMLRGTWLAAEMENTATDHAPYIGVLADGAPVVRLPLGRGRQRVLLLAGMDGTVPHEVTVLRDTQPAGDETAPLRLLSLETDGAITASEERAAMLEFIGDSLTVGEGTLGPCSAQEWRLVWISHMLAFPTLTAEALHADKRVIALGGWGASVSWDGNTQCSIGRIYDHLCAVTPQGDVPCPDSLRPADAVIINLGTNDASGIATLPEGERAQAWEQFCHRAQELLCAVRRRNPRSAVLWVLGMLGHEAEPYIRRALEAWTLRGGGQCEYRRLSASEEAGSRGHPGPAAHLKAAREIMDALRPVLNGEPGTSA